MLASPNLTLAFVEHVEVHFLFFFGYVVISLLNLHICPCHVLASLYVWGSAGSV